LKEFEFVGGQLIWRELLESDLEECLRMQPDALGHELAGRDRAMKVWKALLRSPAFSGRVIERASNGKRGRILAFGSSVFVSAEFLEAETRHPRPGINSRIIASVAEGKPVVLSHDQVAAGNAGAGLHAVFLAHVWWKTSTPVEFSEMMMMSLGSCVDAHAGYRLRSIIVETPGEVMRMLRGHTGDFEIVREFQDVDRVLMRMTRERASAVAGSAANLLFQYREPLFRLRKPDQRLLIAALRGSIDRELADQLGCSLAAVKKRWRSIFDQIEDVMPEMFALPAAGNKLQRGPQRRHLVLSYMREHYEELRPFSRDRSKNHD